MEILDKINKALDCEEYEKCNECPYAKFGECKILLIRDVRELLQYQEKKIDCLLEKSASLRENIEILKDEQQIVRCKDCKHGEPCKNGLDEDAIECFDTDICLEVRCRRPNWYCANGELKE